MEVQQVQGGGTGRGTGQDKVQGEVHSMQEVFGTVGGGTLQSWLCSCGRSLALRCVSAAGNADAEVEGIRISIGIGIYTGLSCTVLVQQLHTY